MAVVTVSGTETPITVPADIASFLDGYGIWYRRFEHLERLSDEATDAEILAAFAAPIDEQKRQGGYTTADVVDLKPTTPNLGPMLARFSSEHWHSEDEVRFIVQGRGVFHIHPRDGRPVFRIEVREGDMINVPEGTWHWFDLCDEQRIRAVRLFQDKAGWTPHYTESGEDRKHEPVCMGPAFIPPTGL